jgi:RHS repeat-associated protein
VAGGTIEEFQRDTNGALLSETGASAADYIYLDRRLLAMRRGGQTYFYLFDHLGSTLASTDGSGATIATYGYDVTGRVVASTGSLANRFTFVGEHGVEDDGVGLYLMGRRHYDAVTGRFVQRDPIGFAGGMNLYTYAEGRPTTLTDPEGTNPLLYYGGTALISVTVAAYSWLTSAEDTVHSHRMLQHERAISSRLDTLNRQACNQIDRPAGHTPDQMIENRIEALSEQRELWKANVRQIGHTGSAAVDFSVNVVETAGHTRTVVRSIRNLWGLLSW